MNLVLQLKKQIIEEQVACPSWQADPGEGVERGSESQAWPVLNPGSVTQLLCGLEPSRSGLHPSSERGAGDTH